MSATIDKKLSSQVMRNYHHFSAGLALITDISEELKASRDTCTRGRKEMETVDKALTHSILATLQKQRSMARCRVVILRLHEVYALLRKENEINSLLKRDEFIQSVSIYKSCLKKLATSGLNKFTCLDALRARFLRTGELISNEVKARLLSLAKHFNPDAFRNLIQAMVNLGDYKVLSEYLRKFIQLAVEENASEAITPFLTREYISSLLSMQMSQGMAKAMMEASSDKSPEPLGNGIAPAGAGDSLESTSPSSSTSDLASPQSALNQLQSPSSLTSSHIASLPRKPFRDLTHHLDRSQFSLAFLTLAARMMDNLFAIQSMMVILGDVAREERKKGEATAATATPPTATLPITVPSVLTDSDDPTLESSEPVLTESESICQSLDHALSFLESSLPTFWHHVSSLVSEFMRGSTLSVTHISVEDFVRVLERGQQFVEIGERFARNGAPTDINGDSKDAPTLASPSSSDPPSLRAVLTLKSTDYIRNFLHESLSTLAHSFATDNFKAITIEPDFDVDRDLKEFRAITEWKKTTDEQHQQPPRTPDDDTQESANQLYEAFLQGSNPFARAVMEQKNADSQRAEEARLSAERAAQAEAARLAASIRPALRPPGSGPTRAAQLNIKIGRPNFALPTVGGMTGGVPTVQPRAIAQAQALAAAQAASSSSSLSTPATPSAPVVLPSGRGSFSSSAGGSLLSSVVDSPSVAPFLLDSSLTLTKIFGRYLALFRSFPTHSLAALDGWRDVIELFAYTIVMQFGMGQSGFLLAPSNTGSASAQAALAELRHSSASPTYLVDSYPTLRSLVCSVKSRVELGVFGGESDDCWARDFRQEDVVAAAATLAQLQAQIAEAANGGAASPTGALAAASQAQANAAAALLAQATPSASEKSKDSFFSKLKDKISSSSLSDRKVAISVDVPAISSSVGVVGSVTHAAQSLASISALHPLPQLVPLCDDVTRELDSPESMNGIVHRMNVYESLSFVFRVLDQHMSLVTQLLPDTPAAGRKVQQFQQYVASIAEELPPYIAGACAPILLPKEAFLAKLNQCRWDIKDLQTKYNAYVDTILNSSYTRHTCAYVPPIPRDLVRCIFSVPFI